MRNQIFGALLLSGCFLVAPVVRAAEPQLETIDLFEGGTQGYALYRIPGIVVTKKGTVLAYCEARRTGKSDWDTIDIMLRRSSDGGRTWTTPVKVADVPGPKTKNPVALAQKLANSDDVTYNNPVAIPDLDGSVHFLFCLEYCRCFVMHSHDEGATWTAPVEITSTFEEFRSEYDWKVFATGPAHGIQLRTGRLVVPVWLSTGTGGHAHRPSVTSTIYSDDGGVTWKRGEIAVPNTEEWVFPNETVVVERADGSVMLNVRSESKRHRRLVTISPDGATGWSEPRFDDVLLEPICMGSIVRFSSSPLEDRNRIVFANPHNLERADGKEMPGKPRDRKNLSIKLSYDEGQTWPVHKVLEAGPSAYSDLAVLRDKTILCFYEHGRQAKTTKKPTTYAGLSVARFNLEWLTDGKDQLANLDGRTYQGAKLDEFKLGDRDAFVIHPITPAPNGAKPWVWYAPTIGQHPNSFNRWMLAPLLEQGFYVVGINVGETYANPRSREEYAEFYRHVTKKYGLDPRVCLLAQSRGGLNHYNFAADHPEWVRCIAGIFPVGDLRSYPGLDRAAPAYGMSAEQLEHSLHQHNPIDRLTKIAAAKIPILHVHGDADKIVPIEQNSQVIYDRYRKLGGPMELLVVPGKGHERDPAFFESQELLDFILRHQSSE